MDWHSDGEPSWKTVSKPCNLPSWSKLQVDMNHIAAGHMPGGPRASPNKGIFDNMSEDEVRNAIRDAYNNSKGWLLKFG